MTSPSPPPAPDYASAAEATAEGNLEMLQQQTVANRPTEVTPLGTRTWEQGEGTSTLDQAAYDQALAQYEQDLQQYNLYQQYPTTHAPVEKPIAPVEADFMKTTPGGWTSTITLSPELQALYEKNIGLQGSMADIGAMSAEQMKNLFATPFTIEGQTPTYQGVSGEMPTYAGPEGEVPTYGGTKQRVMDAMLSRVTGDVQRDRESKHSQLVAQGIPPGSEAYNREMERFDRQLTDARQQAEIAATGLASSEFQNQLAGRGMQSQEAMNNFLTAMQARGVSRQEAMDMYNNMMGSRRQQIQEALVQRQVPINEMSAWRTGSQVQMPQFQNWTPAGMVGGPDYLGATQAQSAYDMNTYNAQQAQQNAILGGLFGLGAGMATGGTGFFA